MAADPDRVARIRCCLEGLSVGDALGERWFSTQRGFPSFQAISDRTLPPRPWEYTDDTQMALSIAEILRRHGEIQQDALAAGFAEHFDPQRGYGPAMYDLLPQLQQGGSWQTLA